tara:strand:- start:56 stop:220 length:165 start_codon:yes stop_codon:yes gene_type:complete
LIFLSQIIAKNYLKGKERRFKKKFRKICIKKMPCQSFDELQVSIIVFGGWHKNR